MKSYRVAGRHSVADVPTGGMVTAEQIVAGGGSVQHLLDTGHIVVVSESSKAAAKMTAKKAHKADDNIESEETD